MININSSDLLGFGGLVGGGLLSVSMLIGCSNSLPVNIHGVNYTVAPFSYVVTDPSSASNTAGGELIDSYAAGGTTCCYELPRNWRPGIKVSIQATRWLGKAADNTLHAVAGTHLVEVPRYAKGKPGELWVLQTADGSFSVVSSDLQPDHPEWPGDTKGWPAPSVAYQRGRWDIDIDHQKFFLNAYVESAAKMKSAPDETAQLEWNTRWESDRKSLEGFIGPQDIRFRKKMQRDNEEGLQQVRARLQQLQKDRP